MPRNKSNKNYFTSDTEDAIILYNNTDCHIKKSKIYAEKIHYPFFKLTQNIIHTFKFYHTDIEDLEDLQHEIEVFLLEKMHLYHHSNNLWKRIKKIIKNSLKEDYNISIHPSYYELGLPLSFREYVKFSPKVSQEQINEYSSILKFDNNIKSLINKLTPPKAYSYFGTIVKRWCILYNEKNYNRKISSYSIEDLIKDESHSYNIFELNKNEELYHFISLYIEYISSNLYEIFPKEQDAQIADSLLEIFKKRENIDIIHKKAIYTYIYEILPEVKTSKITKVANQLKNIFDSNYIYYLDNGYINF